MGFLQRVVSLVAVVAVITILPTGAHAQETTPFVDGSALPPNTDVVRLKGGSVLVGQLKFAERGLLTFDIAGIGDTTIKLSEIAELR